MNLVVEVTSPGPNAPLARLAQLPLGLDLWEVKPDRVVLRAGEPQAERLRQMGYGVEQLHETDSFVSRFATTAAVDAYHSAQSLEQGLRELADQRPDIAELHEIGRSLENRPIWALRLGDRSGSDRKAVVLGCHHAREWISVEVVYLLADHLVDQADRNPVKRLLSEAEIWVAPMVNPDGHEFSRTHNRLWRKNRRPNPDGSFGVDPNRNYGYMWGTLNVSTSSHVPSDETYVGPRAFSEPETQAVRDLIGRELPRGVLTYHSYSQLLLFPWGYTQDPVPDPDDKDRMVAMCKRMARLIGRVHGKTYKPQQASELYPTAGDTTDWAYGVYGVPAFTVELRPESQAQGGFVLPPDQIQPTWEENRPAAIDFLKTVLA